jgi:hypothetical protein
MPAKALPALPDPFTFAQARAAGLTKYALYQLRDSRKIEAIGHGIYRRAASKPAEEDLLEIVMRAPRATLCLATALVHHGLSDMIPPARDVALPRGTRAPATRAIVQWHYFDPSTFDLGRTTLRVGAHLEIGLYSSERSIVDAFRTRGHQGPELANEALRRWLRQRGATPARLLAFAAHFPRTVAPIRAALQVLL